MAGNVSAWGAPRHVHVYKDDRLTMRWDLDHRKHISGEPSPTIVRIIEELVDEGTR
jgi:hypothetical protein